QVATLVIAEAIPPRRDPVHRTSALAAPKQPREDEGVVLWGVRGATGLTLLQDGLSTLPSRTVDDRFVVITPDDPFRFSLPISGLAVDLDDPPLLDGVVLAVGESSPCVVSDIGRVLQDHLDRVVPPRLPSTTRRRHTLIVETGSNVVHGTAFVHELAEDPLD